MLSRQIICIAGKSRNAVVKGVKKDDEQDEHDVSHAETDSVLH